MKLSIVFLNHFYWYYFKLQKIVSEIKIKEVELDSKGIIGVGTSLSKLLVI